MRRIPRGGDENQEVPGDVLGQPPQKRATGSHRHVGAAVPQQIDLTQRALQEMQQPLQRVVNEVARQLPPHVDIDAADAGDPQFCSELVAEVHEYLREYEVAHRVDADYMARQTDINAKMRGILVDWLFEVVNKFRLAGETLYLTIYIIDSYLSKVVCPRNQLQLVGVTALFAAAKFEEVYPIQLDDLIYICNDGFTRRQIIDKEREILTTIDFVLSYPTALHFLRRYDKAADASPERHTLCKFLIEICLLHSSMLRFLPSLQAAGAVYLSRLMKSEPDPWNPTLQHYTGYTEDQVRECARAINTLNKYPDARLRFVYKKYSSTSYMSVASTRPVYDF